MSNSTELEDQVAELQADLTELRESYRARHDKAVRADAGMADYQLAVQRLRDLLRAAAVAPVPGQVILDAVLTDRTGLPPDLREVAVLTAAVIDQTNAMLEARISDIAYLEEGILEATARGETTIAASLDAAQARADEFEGRARRAERELAAIKAGTANSKGRIRRAERELALMQNSLSWRVTRPLRVVRRMLAPPRG